MWEINICVKLFEAILMDFKIAFILSTSFELYDIITKKLVLVVLYSHDLIQNSEIKYLHKIRNLQYWFTVDYDWWMYWLLYSANHKQAIGIIEWLPCGLVHQSAEQYLHDYTDFHCEVALHVAVGILSPCFGD